MVRADVHGSDCGCEFCPKAALFNDRLDHHFLWTYCYLVQFCRNALGSASESRQHKQQQARQTLAIHRQKLMKLRQSSFEV